MPTPSSRLVALITGGTTGIGLATARVLHAEGYTVLVTGQNPDTLAAAQSALPEDVVVSRADSCSIADAERVAGELKKRFGKVSQPAAFVSALPLVRRVKATPQGLVVELLVSIRAPLRSVKSHFLISPTLTI
jgi:NAD(P)-dependent dehydrogenase (short-subunit alcohol dehydrogenase family)